MEDNHITYVQPLNERLRFFMRLAFLLNHTKLAMNGDSVHDTHTALTTLLDIINIVNQQDLKKEVMKELERINQALLPLQNTPDIESNRLNDILESLQSYRSELHAINGPLAQDLRDNEFLKVLQQRHSMPAGLSECDPPVYNHWLHQDLESRHADLSNWLNTFDTVHKSIELILDLVKSSTTALQKTAEKGIYQQSLDSTAPYQMIMVSLPSDSPYFAEISGGKHRFTIRFMDATAHPRPTQTTNDVSFNLYCCAL